MIVFVVSSSNHGEQQGVEAVFSTEEAAREWAARRLWPIGDRAYVQAWTVDAGVSDPYSDYPGGSDVE